jgi:1A family penicillin-binding protein
MRHGIKFPKKNEILKFLRKLWIFPIKFKSKKRRKIFIYTILSIVFVLLAGLAWISKDLPTPGHIKSVTSQQATQILDRNGNLLYSVYGNENRQEIKFADIPNTAKQATVATEDSTFYSNYGIDFRGIARSAYYDIFKRGKGNLHGGSTITQQYVKNALLDNNQSILRKIKEAILAIELEVMYSKDQILTMYLNEIPYGGNAYGIQAASKTYFGIDAKNLDLAQSALLAALPQAPSFYSPYGGHSDLLLDRKNYVLNRMVKLKMITQDQADTAKAEKIAFIPYHENITAPHFVMYVKEVLAAQYGEQFVETGGLKVTTTLDPNDQKIAQQVIEKDSASTLKKSGATNAALTAVDPKTGDILAMVGSVDYFNMQNQGNVNVAISNRSPGSSFKPIVYATGFKDKYSPATTLFDLKTDFGGGYSPNDYDLKNRGPVSARDALANSLNIPAVKMEYMAGVQNSINTAKDFGITTLTNPDSYGLSLVLGGGDVKLLEMTGAYSVFANNGTKMEASPLLKVEDQKGKVLLDRTKVKGKQVLDPQVAYEISSILSDNNARTPIFGAHSALYFPNRTVAAKTGTTQNYRDAWTLGYTPSLAAGVWVGNNDNTPMPGQLAASMAAAPLWHEFMDQALANKPNEDFSKPTGIQTATVDSLTGLLPGKSSPLGTRTDIFTSWQMPKQTADIYTTANVDASCGDKLATDQTPANLVVQKTFANVHSEEPSKPNWEAPVRAWALSAGLGSIAPTETCPIHTDANKPSISITSPGNGATVSGGTTLKVNINAPNGVKSVEYFADGISIGANSSSPFSLTYDMNNLSSGSHTIKARITDNGDWTAENSITINVTSDSTPPGNVVSVNASPGPGGGQISLSWNNPGDTDFSYTNIYMSTSASFSPNSGNRYTHTGNESITITGLSSGTTYYFILRPVDTSGNENGSTTRYSTHAL